MMGIPLREERHLAAQCLYFVNLSTGTQGAAGVAGALWGREITFKAAIVRLIANFSLAKTETKGI